jgi:hypothetical protein
MKQAAKLLGVIVVAVGMSLLASIRVLAIDGHGGGGRGGGFHGGGLGGGRQSGGFGRGFRGGRFRGGYYGGYYGGWGWGGCYPGLAFGFGDVSYYYPYDYDYYPPPAYGAPPPADYDAPPPAYYDPQAPVGPKVYTLSSSATGQSSAVSPPSATAQQSPTILRGSQESVGVADVKAMAKAGLGDGVILSHIRQSQTVYYLTTADIIDLKKSGVSDRVIDFMINTSRPGR